MEITLQYFDGCANWKKTAAQLSALLDEGLGATISYELIDTDEAAISRGFRGSPTLLIDGVDPFTQQHAPVGLACRVYQTEDGYRGSPSLSQLRKAVTSASKE